MTQSHIRSSVSKSSNPICDTLLRWCTALLGIVAAFLIPFDDAKTARGFIALFICAVSAFNQYLAHRKSSEHKAEVAALKAQVEAGVVKVAEVVVATQITSAKADTALLGRKLSPAQMEEIVAKLSSVDVSKMRLIIRFCSDATGAQDFAESIAQFLPKLRIHPEWPIAREKVVAGQLQERINDTLFIVRSNPPAEVEQFVAAFTATVPETHRSGEGTFGYVTSNNQVMIVVGHKTNKT